MKSRTHRFRIKELAYDSGTPYWRVSGTGRDGRQVRENFPSWDAAVARQLELESEFLGRHGPEVLRHTTLTDAQTKIAEVCFGRLDKDDDMSAAVEFWLAKGKPRKAAGDGHRLDGAVEEFKAWLETTESLRERTKGNLKVRVAVFASTCGNIPLASITADTVYEYLAGRKLSAVSRDNDRRALSRFFSWCIERPRRWIEFNPCHGVKLERAEKPAPDVLTMQEVRQLLYTAKDFKGGRLAPYIATALFAGLRPFELARIKWDQANLADGELRIEAGQSKTRRPRVVKIEEPLSAWLKWSDKQENREFFPAGWRGDFDAVREAAKLTRPWTSDVLRHTAISHYWRKTGSYGFTAEWAGNSEAIIRRHYQARVTAEDSASYWSLFPEGERKPQATTTGTTAPKARAKVRR